jgi:hypothetical protein
MDWFKVTHAWAEKCDISGYTRWKFRFEKFDFTTDGWWAAQVSEDPPEGGYLIFNASCLACQQESPIIYQEGWMCLNPGCVKWWKVSHLPRPWFDGH